MNKIQDGQNSILNVIVVKLQPKFYALMATAMHFFLLTMQVENKIYQLHSPPHCGLQTILVYGAAPTMLSHILETSY